MKVKKLFESRKERKIEKLGKTQVKRNVSFLTMGLTYPLHTYKLIELCFVNGEYPMWGGDYSKADVVKCLFEMKKYLLSTKLVPVMLPETELIFPLSDRQITCANICSNAIKEKDYITALHEFADCITDYNSGYEKNRLVTINEYVLYMSLVNGLICCIS